MQNFAKDLLISNTYSSLNKSRTRFALVTLVIFSVVSFTFYLTILPSSEVSEQFNDHELFYGVPQSNAMIDTLLSKGKYLINMTNCRIPNYHPFNSIITPFYKKIKYSPCTDKPQLTYVRYDEDGVGYLTINSSANEYYSYFSITCCFSEVIRAKLPATHKKPDDTIHVSACVFFKHETRPLSPIVRVNCYGLFRKVYSNVHAIISPRYVPDIEHYQKKLDTTPSILMVGIDSFSRLNFIRTMPKSFEFLEKHRFISLKGYMKVGLNTFPAMLATLTGKSYAQGREMCDYNDLVDNCGWIFSRLSSIGYVTAYAEDWSEYGSFNYLSKGFLNPPTDLYLRPYILEAEKDTSSFTHGYECTGPENSAERIFNAATEFLKRFKKYASFGLFWTNTFSHNVFSAPSAMDDKVHDFLNVVYKQLNSEDDNTIFMFLSDHGFRFGDVRNTQAGRLEDSLPNFYIHFPKKFQQMYPQKVEIFRNNSDKLTTAFDLHMTLQEILHQANPVFEIKNSEGCPFCRSLFEEVEENRTCWRAGVPWEYCVCNAPIPVNLKSELVKNASAFVVSKINKFVASFAEGRNCRPYELQEVDFAGKVIEYVENNQTNTNLLMRLVMTPTAAFEAIVPWNYETFNSTNVVNFERMNWYGNVTECINDKLLKRFCFCNM